MGCDAERKKLPLTTSTNAVVRISNLHSCMHVENGRAYRVKVGLFAGLLPCEWHHIDTQLNDSINNNFVFDGIDRLTI